MNGSAKALRDALVRLRAAVLDLSTAGCHAEAAELAALVRRLEERSSSAAPRAAAQGEADARAASPIPPATLGLSGAPVASVPEAVAVPPVDGPPAPSAGPGWARIEADDSAEEIERKVKIATEPIRAMREALDR